MQILRQQNILEKQNENYIAGELSNIALVLQTPQMFVDYFSIDTEFTETVAGLKNIEDYIGPNSGQVYNEIENLPMSGIDNLVENSTWDEETGYDEDFQSSGIIFPNTVTPKPGDFFIINGSKITALYIVDGTTPVTVRSNPFIEISFRLFSRNPETIQQLRKQVKDNLITTVSAIGTDKTLVISKESYFTVQQHVQSYIELADMYKTLFYDPSRAAFIFDGLYDEENDRKAMFLDITLWRLMFDEGIIIYDGLITYAANNMKIRTDPVFVSCPDIYVDDHMYRRSILYRIYSRDHKHQVDEYKYPQSYEPDSQVGKYKGKNLIYFDHYGDSCDCNLMCMTCPEWDEDFMHRLKCNKPYEDIQQDCACVCKCNGDSEENKITIPFNPSLRNAIIAWYNNEEIDWDTLSIDDRKTCENYFLIPLLLGAYKNFIQNLQN